MSEKNPPTLSREQTRWAFAGSSLFLTAIGFLGYALAQGVIVPFAIGWVALQIFGFGGALRIAKGDLAHPLFKSQVMVHFVVLGLLFAIMLRGPA